MPHHTNIFMFAIPLFLILLLIESYFSIRELHAKSYLKDLPVSTTIGLGFIIISFFSKALLLLMYQFIYTHRIFTMPVNVWYMWLLCFIAEDFTYYWFHRLSHQVRVLWASHSVHHSAETYSYATAGLRQTWTGNISGTFIFWLWMPFIGMEPGMILLIKSLILIYQFSIHTEAIKKMPVWFEAVFNTPSHHRVHHANNLMYLDKNYGGMLIIWDRLFGTFQAEEIKPQYGLTKKIQSCNPLIIVFHEWINMYIDIKKSKCLNDYYNYFFNAPGWSKDGSSKTTRELRAGITVNACKDIL